MGEARPGDARRARLRVEVEGEAVLLTDAARRLGLAANRPAGKGGGSRVEQPIEVAVARRQRRWCGLVAYSGDSGERLLALPPARWDEAALCGWLAAFLGRGSTLDVPVRELPDYYRMVRERDARLAREAREKEEARVKQAAEDAAASAAAR